MVERSVLDSESAHFSACRKRRRSKLGIEQRAPRALRCVLDGELSAGRQALEGAELARGTRETLDALKDRERRPPNLHPLPDRVVNHVPHTPVSLDPELFAQTSVAEFEAGRGSRSFRNDGRASASDAREYRRHRIVGFICRHIRQGRSPTGNRRMTALRKLDGGVRGIEEAISSVVWCPELSRSNSPSRWKMPQPRFSTHSKHVLGVSVSRTFSRASLKSIPARP